jgi:hypothetical protein
MVSIDSLVSIPLQQRLGPRANLLISKSPSAEYCAFSNIYGNLRWAVATSEREEVHIDEIGGPTDGEL